MEYRLFDDKGAIFTRTPEVVSDMLYITFEGAPTGATAIFERDDGSSAYKLINDGVFPKMHRNSPSGISGPRCPVRQL